MTVTAVPTSVTNNTATDVLFNVTSEGAPVDGALVTLLGCGVDTSGTTVANGTVTISVTANATGTIGVTATKTGYDEAATTVTVTEVVTTSPLNVTADPTSVTNNTATDVLFNVTSEGTPVDNATVTLSGCGVDVNDTTDVNGTVTISVTATSTGTINVTATKDTYEEATTTIAVEPVALISMNVTAVPTSVIKDTATGVTFNVTSEGTPVDNATVTLSGCGVDVNDTTDVNGTVTIPVTATSTGTINVTATKDTYEEATTTVTVTADPMTVTRDPTSVHKDITSDVLFNVTSEGAPVDGALVTLTGCGADTSGTTVADGTVTISVTANATGTIGVTVTKDTYEEATTTVTVTAYPMDVTADRDSVVEDTTTDVTFSVTTSYDGMCGTIQELDGAQTADIEWNATNFDAFWYGPDDDLWTETFTIKAGTLNGTDDRIIDENNLTYVTTTVDIEYEVNESLGLAVEADTHYQAVGWMGLMYVAVNGKVDKLAKLLVEFEDNDTKTLPTGEAWDLGEGFTLTAKQIDLEGEKVWFSLAKDGIEIDSEVVTNQSLYVYTADVAGEVDVPLFHCYVDAVSEDTNTVQIMYVFLISDDVLEIDTGDEYGVMEVITASSTQIVLKNGDTSLSLDPDSKEQIMGDIYFKTADNDTVIMFGPCVTITEAVDGANVTLLGCGVDKSGTTGVDGTVTISVTATSADTIDVTATKDTYEEATTTVNVTAKEVYRPGGGSSGGDGTYPPGWNDPAPAATTTPAPAAEPTVASTKAPTEAPTKAPTKAPTVAATEIETTELKTEGTPGFGAVVTVFAIAGLLVAAYLVMRRRE